MVDLHVSGWGNGNRAALTATGPVLTRGTPSAAHGDFMWPIGMGGAMPDPAMLCLVTSGLV